MVEKKQCFTDTTLGWSRRCIVCNSRFLYLLSYKTFLIATVSPISRHLAYKTNMLKSALY